MARWNIEYENQVLRITGQIDDTLHQKDNMSRWGMVGKVSGNGTCTTLTTTREETVGTEVVVDVDLDGAAVGDPA